MLRVKLTSVVIICSSLLHSQVNAGSSIVSKERKGRELQKIILEKGVYAGESMTGISGKLQLSLTFAEQQKTCWALESFSLLPLKLIKNILLYPSLLVTEWHILEAVNKSDLINYYE